MLKYDLQYTSISVYEKVWVTWGNDYVLESLDVCDSCENLWTQLCDGVVSASLYPEHASAEWSKKDIHFYSIDVKPMYWDAFRCKFSNDNEVKKRRNKITASELWIIDEHRHFNKMIACLFFQMYQCSGRSHTDKFWTRSSPSLGPIFFFSFSFSFSCSFQEILVNGLIPPPPP